MSLGFTKPPLHDPDAIFKYGKAIGIEQERERVIALLEAEAIDFSEYCTLPLDEEHCQMCNQYVKLIALIKGESK